MATPTTTGSPNTERTGLLAWFARHPMLSIAIVSLVLLTTTVFLLDLVARSRLDRHIAAIRAQEEPVCFADVEVMLPNTPESINRSYQVLSIVRLMRSIDSSKHFDEHLPIQGLADPPPLGVRYGDVEIKAAREYVDRFRGDLNNLHKALHEDEGCFTPSVKTLLTPTSRIPEFEEYRYAARAVAVEVVVAAHDGDSRTAANRIRDIYTISNDLRHAPSIIAYLVRKSCISMGTMQIESTVNLCELTNDDLESLQSQLSSMENDVDIKYAYLTERVETLESFGLAPGNAATSGGGQKPVYPLSNIPMLGAKDAQHGVKLLTDLINALGEPNRETIERVEQVGRDYEETPSYYVTSQAIMAAMFSPVDIWMRTVAQIRAMQACLAAERYRIKYGDWPVTLDDLVPQYLTVVPLDPFTDEALRYKRKDNGIVIYSVAEDETDNNGDVIQYGRKWNDKPADTGFLFLNPDRRNQPAPVETDGSPDDSIP